MPLKTTTRSMTCCRFAFDSAATRHSMSALPVTVCTSSTSGTEARCSRTAAPWPWTISRVAKAVTG